MTEQRIRRPKDRRKPWGRLGVVINLSDPTKSPAARDRILAFDLG